MNEIKTPAAEAKETLTEVAHPAPVSNVQGAVAQLIGGEVFTSSLARLAELFAIVYRKAQGEGFPALQKGPADVKLEQIERWLTSDGSSTFGVARQAEEFIRDLEQWA